MAKPILTDFNQFAELAIQKYERYLPSAFDDSLTMMQKVNMTIEFCNQVGIVTNGLITQWREVMEWVMGEGLNEAVTDKLDDMLASGIFDSLINEVIFGKLNEKIDGHGVNLKYPPAPLVGAKFDGVTDDTIAIRAIVSYAEQMKRSVLIPGVAVITDEIEIKQPTLWQGIGSGEGYGDLALTDYKQISGFLVKGTGTRRIRSRRVHRATGQDATDGGISTALNIQASNVKLRDFSIFLDFNPDDMSPTNYGASFDCGIFVGSRVHTIMENIHVLGYFRNASIRYDVTHATNLPRFKDLNGVEYQNDFNISGGDGTYMNKVFTKGGKWGIFVAGAMKHDTNTNYYDDQLGLVPDYRGSFGFSDFMVLSCSIYGTDHHSNYRRDSFTGNHYVDGAGGCMYIDASAANSSGGVQGLRFIGTRFASFEPFRVRIDRAHRLAFYSCHIENRSSGDRKNPDGTPIDFNTQIYGLVTATQRTGKLFFTDLSGKIDRAYIPSTVDYTNIAPAGDTLGYTSNAWFTNETLIQSPRFQSINGELDLRAETDFGVRMRHGSATLLYANKDYIQVPPSLRSLSGELDLRSATTTDMIRFRRGSTSVFTIGDVATLNYSLVPNVDNALDIGAVANRYRTLIAHGLRLKDTANGKDYLLRMTNGVLTTTEV